MFSTFVCRPLLIDTLEPISLLFLLGPVYEEVALRSRDENKYETLQKAHGARGEAEYDTLFPVTSGREKKEGDYQQLKKEEMKDGTYYTLGMEGAAGGGMI